MPLTPAAARMIPAELRALPQWVNFRIVTDDAGKQRKIPVIPGTTAHAAVDRPDTWRSFEEAAQYDHPAFVFTRDDPYLFLDLDALSRRPGEPDDVWNVRQMSNNEMHAWVRRTFGDSYMERSVSGAGWHIIGRGKLDSGWQIPGLGVYPHSRFCIFTGTGVGFIRDFSASDLSELERLYRPNSSPAQDIDVPKQAPKKSDEEVIDIVRTTDRGLALWEGRWQELTLHKVAGQDDSQSAFDYELIALIWEASQSIEQTCRIFAQSGMYRPKATPTYILRAIKKCVSKKQSEGSFISSAQAGLRECGIDVAVTTPGEPEANVEPGSAEPRGAEPGSVESRGVEPQKPFVDPRKRLLPMEDYEDARALLALMPEGIVRDIALELHKKVLYPTEGISLLTGIAFGAMLFQRWWESPLGMGLNVYLLLLAPTSAGKAPFTAEIPKLLAQVSPGAFGKLWRGELRSEQAVGEALQESPRMVMVKTEADSWFLSMTNADAAAFERGASSTFTTIWSLSTSAYSPTRRARMDAGEYQTIMRPCLSILAETQPQSLWTNLSRHGMTKGVFPRFVVLEIRNDEVPVRHNETWTADWRGPIVERVRELILESDTAQVLNQSKMLRIDEDARKMFWKFMEECRSTLLRENGVDYLQPVYGKLAENAGKIASIIAASQYDKFRNPEPVITGEIMQWSIAFVRFAASRVEDALMDGNISDASPNDMIDVILTKMNQIQNIPLDQRVGVYFSKFGNNRALALEPRLIPISFLRNRVAKSSAFRKESAERILGMIHSMSREGMIGEIFPKSAVKQAIGANMACVSMDPDFSLDMIRRQP